MSIIITYDYIVGTSRELFSKNPARQPMDIPPLISDGHCPDKMIDCFEWKSKLSSRRRSSVQTNQNLIRPPKLELGREQPWSQQRVKKNNVKSISLNDMTFN